MFGGNWSYTDGNENEWEGLPYNPKSRPDADDDDLREIFSDKGWRTWGDFYDDKLGLSRSNPDASRPPYLGDVADLIKELYDRGILDYVVLEFDGDYIDYEIDY